VQGENYDTGGQGIGYDVSSTNKTGNSYRSDGVDLEVTADTGGGYDLGWTANGQWFRYTVNVCFRPSPSPQRHRDTGTRGGSNDKCVIRLASPTGFEPVLPP
jgi:hypothetical protein